MRLSKQQKLAVKILANYGAGQNKNFSINIKGSPGREGIIAYLVKATKRVEHAVERTFDSIVKKGVFKDLGDGLYEYDPEVLKEAYPEVAEDAEKIHLWNAAMKEPTPAENEAFDKALEEEEEDEEDEEPEVHPAASGRSAAPATPAPAAPSPQPASDEDDELDDDDEYEDEEEEDDDEYEDDEEEEEAPPAPVVVEKRRRPMAAPKKKKKKRNRMVPKPTDEFRQVHALYKANITGAMNCLREGDGRGAVACLTNAFECLNHETGWRTYKNIDRLHQNFRSLTALVGVLE